MTQPLQPSVHARAVELLDALGPTVTDVARNLQAAGIKGERAACYACPITVYLLNSDLGCTAVDTGDVEIALWFAEYPVAADDVVYVDTPDPVAQFINQFDNGAYNQLAVA
jgi:hypothetical protein